MSFRSPSVLKRTFARIVLKKENMRKISQCHVHRYLQPRHVIGYHLQDADGPFSAMSTPITKTKGSFEKLSADLRTQTSGANTLFPSTWKVRSGTPSDPKSQLSAIQRRRQLRARIRFRASSPNQTCSEILSLGATASWRKVAMHTGGD